MSCEHWRFCCDAKGNWTKLRNSEITLGLFKSTTKVNIKQAKIVISYFKILSATSKIIFVVKNERFILMLIYDMFK